MINLCVPFDEEARVKAVRRERAKKMKADIQQCFMIQNKNTKP